MAKSLIEIIQSTAEGRVELNVPMSQLTTIRTGGPADIIIRPLDRNDLSRIVKILGENEVETFFMGNGSSIIVRDGGIRGAVIKLTEGFNTIEKLSDNESGVTFRVDAGVSLRSMLRWCVDKGVAGLEFLYGIPGTVGGSIINNSGSWGEEIGGRVVELETVDKAGEFHTIGKDRFAFDYRRSKIPEGHNIVSAVLACGKAPSAMIKDAMQKSGDKRRSMHPVHDPCAGMTFMNPKGMKAGEIIDGCGLKGVRVGDAEISRMHANFIVNLGSAQATQIVSLIGMIQERVYVKRSLKLEPKVKVVGSWQKSKLRISE